MYRQLLCRETLVHTISVRFVIARVLTVSRIKTRNHVSSVPRIDQWRRLLFFMYLYIRILLYPYRVRLAGIRTRRGISKFVFVFTLRFLENRLKFQIFPLYTFRNVPTTIDRYVEFESVLNYSRWWIVVRRIGAGGERVGKCVKRVSEIALLGKWINNVPANTGFSLCAAMAECFRKSPTACNARTSYTRKREYC